MADEQADGAAPPVPPAHGVTPSLAPPLVQPPAPQQPPYPQNPAQIPPAQIPAQNPQNPAAYGPQQPPYPQNLPYPSSPPQPERQSRMVAIMFSVGGFLLVLLIGFGAFFLINRASETTGPSIGTESDATGIAAKLEAKITEYKQARDDGSLWRKIDNNEFNRTAVTAFLYLLTDMKVAATIGVEADTAREYAAEMAHLEELLLAEKPLGSDVEIDFGDNVFRYDGDTGEGGYSDE